MDELDELTLRLHSRYQPQVEADRYINSLRINPNADHFIMIEPGKGYLINALRKNYPDAKIVVLHADSRFRNAVSGICMWYPGSGDVQEFLEKQIPDTATVRIIEWQPSLNVFGEIYLWLVRESAAFVKRTVAGRRTTAAFGNRWVKNFFRNLLIINDYVLYRQMDMPVVVTGAGPSLEKIMPKIIAAREGIFILAASSSLQALQAGGILPDMVIATDGGGWALAHLHSFFRSACAAARTKVALYLCAAVPSRYSAIPLLPLSDGSLWQSIALNAAGIPSISFPQRGTVTASAIDLAMVLTCGDIYLAGMDLSVDGIKSHARPNAFESMLYDSASRTQPVYSQYFKRSRDIISGGSMEIYASWFKGSIASWPERIFTLGGNHEVFEKGLPEKQLNAGKRTYVPDFFGIAALKDSPEGRLKRAVGAISAALDDPKYSSALADELAPLLLPSEKKPSSRETAQALHKILQRYREDTRG